MKNKVKKVAYKNLPRSHQLAIAHYMAIDGEAWEVEYEFEGGGSGYIKDQLKKALPLFIKKYGRCRFGIDEVSPVLLIEKIMKLEHIQKDFKGSFEKYHKWYKKNCAIPRHNKINRWPCIMDSTTDPIYNGVLEDGWHRFHRYIDAGHKTIPCVFYLPKENYKYA